MAPKITSPPKYISGIPAGTLRTRRKRRKTRRRRQHGGAFLPNNRENSGELNWKESDGINALLTILNTGRWSFKLPPNTRDLPSYLKKDGGIELKTKAEIKQFAGNPPWIFVPFTVKIKKEGGPEESRDGYLKIRFQTDTLLSSGGTYSLMLMPPPLFFPGSLVSDNTLPGGIYTSNHIFINKVMRGGRRRSRKRRKTRRRRSRKRRRRRRSLRGGNVDNAKKWFDRIPTSLLRKILEAVSKKSKKDNPVLKLGDKELKQKMKKIYLETFQLITQKKIYNKLKKSQKRDLKEVSKKFEKLIKKGGSLIQRGGAILRRDAAGGVGTQEPGFPPNCTNLNYDDDDNCYMCPITGVCVDNADIVQAPPPNINKCYTQSAICQWLQNNNNDPITTTPISPIWQQQHCAPALAAARAQQVQMLAMIITFCVVSYLWDGSPLTNIYNILAAWPICVMLVLTTIRDILPLGWVGGRRKTKQRRHRQTRRKRRRR